MYVQLIKNQLEIKKFSKIIMQEGKYYSYQFIVTIDIKDAVGKLLSLT